jgi:hypothetical protein
MECYEATLLAVEEDVTVLEQLAWAVLAAAEMGQSEVVQEATDPQQLVLVAVEEEPALIQQLATQTTLGEVDQTA